MGESKRRKQQLLGEMYGKNRVDYPKSIHKQNKLPQPEKVRTWDVISYNPKKNDYILTSVDHELNMKFVTCLKCDVKLKLGEEYKGYKDVENRT